MNFQVSRYDCLPNLPDYRDCVYGAAVEPAGAVKVTELYRTLPNSTEHQRFMTKDNPATRLPPQIRNDFWTIRVVQ
jgi:hypothetical protein